MSTYWLHPDAFADLNNIGNSSLRIALMQQTALAGHLRPDLSSRPMRFWLVHSYLIAYVPEQPLLNHRRPAAAIQE